MMNNILIKPVFDLKEGQIDLIRITNGSGAYVEVINLGATIVSIVVPDKDGKLANIVLCHNDFHSYLSNFQMLGASIGRVANRISNARFEMNGKVYYLDKNDGQNSIHGGLNGFYGKRFNYHINDSTVFLNTTSTDGEGGFPGNLDFSVSYSFSDNNELIITYSASTDKLTPINFTNHAYFNLSGEKTLILDDKLRVNATTCIESNNDFLPTGRVIPVSGTAFDFREYTPISRQLIMKNDNMKGYNTYFLKDEQHEEHKPLASLRNTTSGRAMDTYTSMPGVLVYTGDYLSGQFVPFEGICFEAQYPPDAVNQPSFKQNLLQSGIVKKDTIKYHFYII
jgi:aldose 1-epimerase